MRTATFIPILLIFCTVGCRNKGHQMEAYIDSLMAETRFYEGQLYELQHEHEKLQREYDRLKDRDVSSGTSRSARPSSRPPIGSDSGTNGSGGTGTGALEPPDIDTGTPMVEPPDIDTSPPEIDIPGLEDGEGNGNDPGPQPFVPPNLDLDTSTGPELIPSPLPDEASYGPDNEITDFKVADVVIHPSHSRGVNTDRTPGDDAIAVLIQPRNSSSQVLEDWEKISVVMIDPALPGDQARVARWDLTPEHSKPWQIDAAPASGIKFLLPWTDAAPINNRMKLFVRYETKDKRKLVAEGDMFITLEGDVSDRWTPRTHPGHTEDRRSQVADQNPNPNQNPRNQNLRQSQPQPRSAELPSGEEFPEWSPNR